VGAWVCYLLECADGTLYCGITNDLDRRLAAHNAGAGAKYTRSRTPVQLAYAETLGDRSAALKREAEIKKLDRSQKLKLTGSLRHTDSIAAA
jgi:putative endonuclease